MEKTRTCKLECIKTVSIHVYAIVVLVGKGTLKAVGGAFAVIDPQCVLQEIAHDPHNLSTGTVPTICSPFPPL